MFTHSASCDTTADDAGSWAAQVAVALALAALCFGGSIRYVLGVEQLLYYAALGVLTLTTLQGLHRLQVARARLAYLLILLSLIVWLLLSTQWTISAVQWKADVRLLAALGAIGMLTAFNGGEEVVRRFLTTVVLVAFGIGLFVLVNSQPNAGGSIADAYLTLSSAIGAGFVVSMIHALHSKHNRLLWGLASLLLMAALSQSLARGALISSIGIIFLIALYHAGRELLRGEGLFKRARRYIVFAVPVLVALVALALTSERTQMRLNRMMDVESELQEGGRGALWNRAFEAIQEAPFLGHGLGSSGVISSGDEQGYPHNFLLQLWLDGGLVAVALGSALIVIPLFTLWGRIRTKPFDPIVLSLFALLLFFLAEFSKSFSFYTARPLLIIATLGLCYVWSTRDDPELSAS